MAELQAKKQIRTPRLTQYNSSRIPMNACDQCSRRKLACSKGVPKCQRCTDDMRTCTYSVQRSAGRPRKISTTIFPPVTPPGVDFDSAFQGWDMAFEAVTPIPEASTSSLTPSSGESEERGSFELHLATPNQEIIGSTYQELRQHDVEESGNLGAQLLEWSPDSLFTPMDNHDSPSICFCIYGLLNALQSITPMASSNDATTIVSCKATGTIRTSFSACEQLVQCPHAHPSACIMLLLAIVQCIDDILYRMTVVFKEEYRTALEMQSCGSSTKKTNPSFLRRSDLMRGIMLLAAATTMDQTEYGVEKGSSRPMGTFLDYIVKIRSNFESRISDLF